MAYVFVCAVITSYFNLHLVAILLCIGRGPAYWLKRVSLGHDTTEFWCVFGFFTAVYAFCVYLAREFPKLQYKKALAASGLKGADDKHPKVVRIKKSHEGKLVSVFCHSPGLGLADYEKIKANLEVSTGQDIEWLRRDEKTRRLIEIAFTKVRLPKLVRFKDACEGIGEAPYRFVVGRSKLETIYKNITELPHLIVAGSTNSGKSNFLNSFIISMLKSPDRVKLNLIDLKHGVEFSRYENIEGVTVASTEDSAVKMLHSLCLEMDRRYRVMKKKGIEKLDPSAEGLPLEVVVVDEAAVLFDMSGKDKDGRKVHQIARNLVDDLARRARASGIHVVLATQKVTIETIDSRIQGNIESKLCFKVPSKIHSRLVIERGDAADLPDIKGRAIWHRGNDYIQVQVPLIERKEILDEISKIKFQRARSARMERDRVKTERQDTEKSQLKGPEDIDASSTASSEFDTAAP